MYENLTEKQKLFFDELKEKYGSKALPSFEKLKNVFNFKSKNSIRQYFETFKKEDLIFCEDNHFFINPDILGANFMSSYVKAGFASVMDDKIEKRVSFDNLFNINSPSTFIFKVSGDSMQDIGILDGDYVVIKKTQSAKVGDVVLAVVDNEFTLKTYKKDASGVFLKPENKNYPVIRPKFSLSVFGVAIGITRKF